MITCVGKQRCCPSLVLLRANRRAFTMVEMVVSIAIVVVFIGLTFPAIQRVRGAMARSRCGSNLRQIGLGLHQYNDTYGALPPGLASDRRTEPFPYLGWTARILPFLEHAQMWREIEDSFKAQRNFLGVPRHIHRSKVVRAFTCPVDNRVESPGGSGHHEWGYTSYLGSEGRDQFSRDGLLYLDSAIALSKVPDGVSNTLMVGERPPSADGILGWWYAGWGQQQDGSAEMVIGAREINIGRNAPDCPPGPYHFVRGRVDNQCDAFHFWSLHSGGANFLLADGSVHFLRYSADAILTALATRAGGEAIGVPD